jgi:hypothetical protein
MGDNVALRKKNSRIRIETTGGEAGPVGLKPRH